MSERDIVRFLLAPYEPSNYWSSAELMVEAAVEILSLRKRRAELEGVVAAHEFARSSIRVFWSFGSDQHHTHNYHSREDFVALWDARVRAAAEKGGAR